jgi:hydroxymethylglutaryl-CoA lyase
MALQVPSAVRICEVGPRDGFQMEKDFIPTAAKVAIIDRLSEIGLPQIQVTSFVHPKAIPQLADADEVMSRIRRKPGVRYTALVPNERGAERAIRAEVDVMELFVSVSESHCLANIRMSTDEAMEKAREVARIGEQAGVQVEIGFPTALGCPFDGFQPYERIERLVGRAVEEFGLKGVNIADTVGMANPSLVADVMSRLTNRFPDVAFSLHLHNTRGMGLANMLAGLSVGVTRFDTSVAGLGGCPFAPGASGNVASEDAVHMLEVMEISTGVSIDSLLDVARAVEQQVGHSESALLRAGTSADLPRRNRSVDASRLQASNTPKKEE